MILVGIDPGVHTGVAVWDTTSRQLLNVTCLGIVEAMEYLHTLDELKPIAEIVVEDARLRRWIPREKDINQFKGRAMGAGSVKRDCSIWEEWCEFHHIRFRPLPPRNNVTKLSDAQFRSITGYERRTNEHGRDAAMLVFGR